MNNLNNINQKSIEKENTNNEEIDNTIINSAKFVQSFAFSASSAGAIIFTIIYLIIYVLVFSTTYSLPGKIDAISEIINSSVSAILFSGIPCLIATILSLLSSRTTLFLFNLIFIIINVIFILIG